MTQISHPSGINQAIVNKVVARRGRLHAFEQLNPSKTALVVVDLDEGTVTRVDNEIRKFIPTLNTLVNELRAQGGKIVWIATPIQKASKNFRAIYGDELTRMYEQEGVQDGKATYVWHELSTQPTDIYVTKQGHSAFFPGKCNLHEQLQVHGISSVLIAGAVTNVCCEASARDAAELQYEVTLISDALSGQTNGLHEASLATFFRNYGDVRPTNEVIELLKLHQEHRDQSMVIDPRQLLSD